MKTSYVWPIFGNREGVVLFSESRSGSILDEVLSGSHGILVSAGCAAYEKYIEKTKAIVHARCWPHTTCWTEVRAKCNEIFQSLRVTCRLKSPIPISISETCGSARTITPLRNPRRRRRPS
jgi:hypothetical protein